MSADPVGEPLRVLMTTCWEWTAAPCPPRGWPAPYPHAYKARRSGPCDQRKVTESPRESGDRFPHRRADAPARGRHHLDGGQGLPALPASAVSRWRRRSSRAHVTNGPLNLQSGFRGIRAVAFLPAIKRLGGTARALVNRVAGVRFPHRSPVELATIALPFSYSSPPPRHAPSKPCCRSGEGRRV